MQFQKGILQLFGIEEMRILTSRVLKLADFVRNNLPRFGDDDVERARIDDAWSELIKHISEVTQL